MNLCHQNLGKRKMERLLKINDEAGDSVGELQAEGLTQLLADTMPRPRCIDTVAAKLDEIMVARSRKITWDAIAEAMGMHRCTLINAVKTLQNRANRTQAGLRHTPCKPEVLIQPAAEGKTITATPVSADIKMVGRARRENFNF